MALINGWLMAWLKMRLAAKAVAAERPRKLWRREISKAAAAANISWRNVARWRKSMWRNLSAG
jgi:hypothetical protein